MSSDWKHTYNSVFLINITSSAFGFFTIVVTYCLRSKCDDVHLCFGLVTVHRNVELKSQEETE